MLVYISCRYTFKAGEEWRSCTCEGPGCATRHFTTIHLMSQPSHSPTDVPDGVPLGQTPLIIPADDGSYACDICGKSIHVRGGGNKNFLQHRGSPGCLKAAKKATAASSARQAAQNTVKITSFFSKEAVKVPKPTGSTTGLAARAPLSPHLLPCSSSGPPDRPGNQTASSVGN